MPAKPTTPTNQKLTPRQWERLRADKWLQTTGRGQRLLEAARAKHGSVEGHLVALEVAVKYLRRRSAAH